MMIKKITLIIIVICTISLLGIWYKCNGYENSIITYFSDSILVDLTDLSKIRYKLPDIVISENDLIDEKNNVILQNIELVDVVDRITPVEGDTVFYDILIFDYSSNDILQIRQNQHIVLGQSGNNKSIEKYLSQATVGEFFSFTYTDENDLPVEKVKIKISSIKETPATDANSIEYIEKNFGIHSFEEFDDYIYKIVYSRKQDEQILTAYKYILEIICTQSSFKINRQELNNVYNGMISLYQDLAHLYDMEMSDYIHNILGISQKEFYQRCYTDSLLSIQQTLVESYLLENKVNTHISTEDFLKRSQEEGYTELQILRNPDIENKVKNLILEDRLIEYVISEFTTN